MALCIARDCKVAGFILLLVLHISHVCSQDDLDDWIIQIEEHRDDVNQIISYVRDGAWKGQTYQDLSKLVDLYGQRISGTQELEDAIDYLADELRAEFGEENVVKEEVSVPYWVRGEEWASFTVNGPEGPLREHPMYIMSTGTSNGTQAYPDGILTAPILIVASFSELEERCSEAVDKIVVYNQPWEGYSNVFMYRSEGASRAAFCGAKAALIRSLTQYSLYSPHTGVQTYNETLSPEQHIPSACITTEDADLLQRLVDAGDDSIQINLYMEAQNMERRLSYNLYADIPGTTFPDELVIFGGHIDSWDVGTGAMDDAGGVVVSWEVLKVMKNLGFQAQRTVRAIFWTAEEFDASGADVFFENHNEEPVSIIMETDAGTFLPTGIGFQGSGMSRAILEELLKLLEEVNTTHVTDDMGGSVDIAVWMDAGFQSAVLNNVEGSDEYFHYHHTEADTVTVQDSDEMDLCTILWTTVAYVVADFDDMLPMEGDYPEAA